MTEKQKTAIGTFAFTNNSRKFGEAHKLRPGFKLT
jgi:hypothetical protein